MPAALTLTDNANGTATAAVTGGPAGELVSVYAAPLDWWNENSETALAGTVLLDGTGAGVLTFAAAPRLYFVFVLSGGLPLASGGRVQVTDGTLPIGTRVRRAVRSRIEALGLPNLKMVAESITLADAANLEFPCIILTSENVAETDLGGMNLTDDVGFPVKVTIADRVDQFDSSMLPTYERWRYDTMAAFRSRQLDAPFEAMTCTIEYDSVIDPNAPQYQMVISEFTIRVHCRLFRPGG